MIEKSPFDRRQILQLGAGLGASAAAGLAITPQAIAQAPQGGPLKPFTIASTSGTFSAIVIALMKRRGYLEKYGIDGNFVTVSDGTKVISAVLNGEVDMVRSAGISPVLTFIEKGGSLKVISGAGLLISQAIYTAKPEIKTLKDLEGKTVGTGAPGALLHSMTVALMRKKGVDDSKVRFVNVGSSADVLRAVVAGTVDAGPAQNDIHAEQAKYGVHSIAEFWNELPEYPYNAGFTADRAIAEKHELIVRCLAAYGELYKYFQDDPNSKDVFINAYNEAIGKREDVSGEYQWSFMQKYKPYGLNISEESITYLQKLNVEMGAQKTVLPVDKVADLSMAREAMKMIGS